MFTVLFINFIYEIKNANVFEHFSAFEIVCWKPFMRKAVTQKSSCLQSDSLMLLEVPLIESNILGKSYWKISFFLCWAPAVNLCEDSF